MSIQTLIAITRIWFVALAEDGVPPGTAASSYLMQSNFDMDLYGDAPDKMTYTEQANKRSHCRRLTW